MTSQLLFVALDLDVFTTIAHVQTPTVESIYARLSTQGRYRPHSADMLEAFLDGLVGCGFLYKSAQGVYQLPADVTRYLVATLPPQPQQEHEAQNPNFMGGMVAHCRRLYDLWNMLPDVIQTGMPAGGAQQLAEAELRYAELAQALYASNIAPAKKLAHWLKQLLASHNPQAKTIADLAGGTGVWSIALLSALKAQADAKALADISVDIIDYETVLTVTGQFAERSGYGEHIKLICGDLETMTLAPNRYDVVFLAHICHVLGEEASQRLLQQAANSLTPNGIIAIVDFLSDPARSNATWPMIYNLNLRITTPTGRVIQSEQMDAWLNQAGLKAISRFELEPDVWATIAAHNS